MNIDEIVKRITEAAAEASHEETRWFARSVLELLEELNTQDEVPALTPGLKPIRVAIDPYAGMTRDLR